MAIPEKYQSVKIARDPLQILLEDEICQEFESRLQWAPMTFKHVQFLAKNLSRNTVKYGNQLLIWCDCERYHATSDVILITNYGLNLKFKLKQSHIDKLEYFQHTVHYLICGQNPFCGRVSGGFQTTKCKIYFFTKFVCNDSSV